VKQAVFGNKERRSSVFFSLVFIGYYFIIFFYNIFPMMFPKKEVGDLKINDDDKDEKL